MTETLNSPNLQAELAEYFEGEAGYWQSIADDSDHGTPRHSGAMQRIAVWSSWAEQAHGLDSESRIAKLLLRSRVVQGDGVAAFGEESKRALRRLAGYERPNVSLANVLEQIESELIADWREWIEAGLEWPEDLSSGADAEWTAVEALLRWRAEQDHFLVFIEEPAVGTLRVAGWSWFQIADLLGQTKQAVWKRHGGREMAAED